MIGGRSLPGYFRLAFRPDPLLIDNQTSIGQIYYPSLACGLLGLLPNLRLPAIVIMVICHDRRVAPIIHIWGPRFPTLAACYAPV